MTLERRTVPTEFETRSEGGTFTFYGYALKWDARSQNLGGFRERVANGATTEAIELDDIRALYNHDPNMVLGRNRSGTLRLSEDSTGLHYEVPMPDTSYARDLAVSMERGDVTQSSFGFRVKADGDSWTEDDDGFPLRTLTRVGLFDVSPVTYPAYNDSTSGVGSRALELLAERRGIPVGRLDSPDAIRAAIRGEVEVPALSEARSRSLDLHDRDHEAFALSLRAMRL
ncbi:HK97 family phage prohead protease [Streptomyces sp. NPDC002755]